MKTVSRVCRRCGKRKPCRYDKITNTFNHTQKLCIQCNREIAKEWYEENSERKRQYQKEYYEKSKKSRVQ